MNRDQEHIDFEAARTVHAICSAASAGDLDTITELWSVERRLDEWRAIAEQALCALIGAMKVQVRTAEATPEAYHASSIRALVALETLGAPPPRLSGS